MAITRLTDIVATMKSKWTYGDKDFAYTFEVNEQHNTNYPYLMINPPNSEFPEVYGGWEAYDFEIDFFDLYQTANQNAVSLEKEWDNLQDLALEWIDNVMIFYNNPTGDNVGIYFLEETIEFDRVKEVANDRLVQIKMRFTMRAVTRCLFGSIPNSYPNQIANLAVWLRADSGVTYSKSTKKVSAWDDQSGNSNDLSQPTSAIQPKRYSYGGASDKTRIDFDGTDDYIRTTASSPITTDFTIFTVAKVEPVTPAFTNTYSSHFTLSADVCEIGNPAGGAGGQLFSFTDGANDDQPFSVSVWANIDPTEPWRGWVEKYQAGGFEWTFKPEYSSGYITFKLSDASTSGYIHAQVISYAAAKKGQWQHYVATYDGSNLHTGLKIYIDGVESQTTTGGGGVYNGMELTVSPLDIGNGNGNSYYGDIDEVSVFDAELTQANVTELYNLGDPTDVLTSTPNPNLIGWWRMGDGATYPTIPDDSTNSNDGTLINMSAADIRANAPNSEASTYFSYEPFGNVRICLGSSSERLYCHLADTTQAFGEWNARYIWDGDTSQPHISMMKLENGIDIISGTTDFAVAGVLSDSNADFVNDGVEFGFVVTDTATGLTAWVDGAITATDFLITDINGGLATLETSGVNYTVTASSLKLQYNDSTPMEDYAHNHLPTQTYNSVSFTLGNGTHLGYLDGYMQELLVYNRALNSTEIGIVKDYLNNKYKIY
tara:strand:+ start:7629 stop:9770 length:2142 start_codon:yes stop_codon:yes gene_type:complete